MNVLRDLIVQSIRTTGPLTLADYMRFCLGHPEHGYYATRDPLGAAGDFTTAPEVSQMFGELIGLWLAGVWIADGKPSSFVLGELGPGRGTLMADILRATRGIAGFREAADVWLVETSPKLTSVQKETLMEHDPSWTETVEDLPHAPLYLVANEFFDALPVRQFRRDGAGWAERMVGLDDDGALAFGFAPPLPIGGLADMSVEDGIIVETSAQAEAISEWVGTRLAEDGGAALFVDYGSWDGTGDTFQALEAHEFANPLKHPGFADLTAHVRFAPLAAAARRGGASRAGFDTQGAFLERLGITDRARRLADGLTGDALQAHVAAHRRLCHPDEMGSLFKVMALRPPGHDLTPGFSAY